VRVPLVLPRSLRRLGREGERLTLLEGKLLRGVDDFITRLASDTSPNAGMLRAYLTAALGKPVEGLSIARASKVIK
jgi:hypothetical protein